MLAYGNSGVGACARNLLSMQQREAPFARSKGMDPDVFDLPFNEAGTYLDESARDVLGAYEPRVDAEGVRLDFEQGGEGEARYTVSLADPDGDADDGDGYWEDDD